MCSFALHSASFFLSFRLVSLLPHFYFSDTFTLFLSHLSSIRDVSDYPDNFIVYGGGFFSPPNTSSSRLSVHCPIRQGFWHTFDAQSVCVRSAVTREQWQHNTSSAACHIQRKFKTQRRNKGKLFHSFFIPSFPRLFKDTQDSSNAGAVPGVWHCADSPADVTRWTGCIPQVWTWCIPQVWRSNLTLFKQNITYIGAEP